MSWFPQQKRTWLERLCCKVLCAGATPRHVALIMDGNRRFAKKCSIEKIEGHVQGFNKLAETLEWCLDLGIKEVTVYAFSIENFKRPKEEVDGLMDLAVEKFKKLLEEKDKLMEQELCVRVIGNLSLLPKDLQKIIAEAVLLTKTNNRAILNVCFCYTSREEISTAIREIAHGVKEGKLRASDCSEELIEKCLYTNKSPHPDLLIRTSGEVRLSDFMLWQCAYSSLAFVKVLWPEFNIWHLFAAVLMFQYNLPTLEAAKLRSIELREKVQMESDLMCALKEAGGDTSCTNAELYLKNSPPESSVKHLTEYQVQREQRIQLFLRSLDEKREAELQNMLVGDCNSC